MIYIIGLGPSTEKYLTMETIEILKDGSKKLYLRTEVHPIVDYLKKSGIEYKSFDNLYDESDSFDGIYEDLVRELIELSKKDDIVYAVPGNPFVAEDSVSLLLQEAKNENIEVKVFPALSYLDVVHSVLDINSFENLLIIDSINLRASHLRKSIPTLLIQLYSQHVASEVKLELMEVYPDTYPITVISSAGIPEKEKIEEIPLYKLDRLDSLNHLTCAYIKANQFPLADEDMEISGNTQIERLINIVSYLRSPNGCPWDKKQTHESLKRYIIEEAYEVLEAIDSGNKDFLKDELGDLLLQVVLQSQLASEENVFDFEDVAENLSEKLLARHPHIFANYEGINTPSDVRELWEKIKNKEKDKDSKSYLSEIPKSLPALMKADKIQKKAQSVGFDWENIEGVFDKLLEEQIELKEAYESKDKERIFEELGDVFFSLVNISRWLKIDPELSLMKANEKFINRFTKVEEEIKKQDKNFQDFNINELEDLWQKAKDLLK